MATYRFAATVEEWCKDVIEAQEAIFREASQRLVHELDDLITQLIYSDPSTDYRRTGFLRASLVASTTAMPGLTKPNPGVPVQADYGDVILTINGLEIGETLYLGYTAKYGAYVHYGTSKMRPRPWVQMVAQRWETIVEEEAAKVRSRFGL
ncbi:HK97 gp10 family phage protein [Oricola thermophila]|uniref:HK97 gp10 family phage protein n=1 Tax=Oricola thermophila TaxID=2742145 RepID=A0A6N1VBC3_9HYPH|nr:HK97 gp10 family phage protein [Oricola thermophila]QKV17853.1 HK97 gp10 family phage protein [Oricola thermophila]